MNRTAGWWLVIAGVGVEAAMYTAQSEANLKGITVDQTTFGGIVGPIDNVLPIHTGTLMIVIGGLMLLI